MTTNQFFQRVLCRLKRAVEAISIQAKMPARLMLADLKYSAPAGVHVTQVHGGSL